jgi:hypothetical protein
VAARSGKGDKRLARGSAKRAVAKILGAWLGTLLVAAWVWSPAASSAPSTDQSLTIAGTLPIPPAFTTSANISSLRLAVDSPGGLVYEIGSFAFSSSVTKFGVQVVDAVTHELVGSPIVLTPPNGKAVAQAQSARPIVDEIDHLLFVPVTWASANGVSNAGIFVVDGRQRTVRNGGNPIIPWITPQELQVIPDALSFDPVSRRLYAFGAAGANSTLSGAVGVTPATPMYLQALDPLTGASLWPGGFAVVGCERAPLINFGGLPLASAGSVSVACVGLDALGAVGSQPEVTQGVFQIKLTDGQPPQLTSGQAPGTGISIFPIPGFYAAAGGGVMADPGGQRILFMSPFPGPHQVFVFDVPTHRIVGLMGIEANSNPQAGCLDQATGRAYLYTFTQSDSARGTQNTRFLVGEARGQGTPYPQVKGFPNLFDYVKTVFRSMACDWVRHQVIGDIRTNGLNDDTLVLIRDDIPQYSPPPPQSLPDAATTGGPYDPATSPLLFEGDGKGFGAQVRLVGGWCNLATSVVSSGGSCNDFPQPPAPTLASIVSPGTPVVTLGATGLPASPQGVTLADSQATSAAEGVARDGGVAGDMAQPGRVIGQLEALGGGGPPPPDSISDPWAYPITACAASPGDAAKSSSQTGATVTCDPTGYQTSALAEAKTPAEIPGVLSVAGAGSSVTSRLDKTSGLLSTTTQAWAKTIVLGGGEIEIDNAVAAATAQAGGQPGTAKATYTRSIGKLVIHGLVVCAPCDPNQVAKAINTNPYTQPTIRAVVPVPAGASATSDGQRYDLPGTTKGAQASVANADDAQTEDEAVNEQSAYDQEVPALRLEFANDSFQHVALILDLAAPQAFSRLDILPCDSCSGGALGALSTDTTETVTPTVSSALSTPPVSGGSEPQAPAQSLELSRVGPPAGALGFSPILASYSSLASPLGSPTTYGSTGLPATVPGAPRPMSGILGQLGGGLRAAFTAPGKFIQLLLVWIVMAVPVYLAARRRLVVDHILGPSPS